ncbi:MAG: type II toxin-antitoxin system HicB family antitoxin [Candidatus Brocadiales bacterium]
MIFEPLEEGGYQVIVPAIPDIITCGRTLGEAKELAQDAIRCDLEGLVKDGESIPKDITTEPITEKLEVSLEKV